MPPSRAVSSVRNTGVLIGGHPVLRTLSGMTTNIVQMNANPNWKHSDKILPDEQDELMTRTPMMNIYENNVFYACERGLAIPEIGRETCAIKDNISYDEGTDLGFVCEDAGNYALKDDSIIYRDIPDFEKMPFEKMGLAL